MNAPEDALKFLNIFKININVQSKVERSDILHIAPIPLNGKHILALAIISPIKTLTLKVMIMNKLKSLFSLFASYVNIRN